MPQGRPRVAACLTPLEKGGGMAKGYAGGFLSAVLHLGQKPPVSFADSPLFKGAFFALRWAGPTPDTPRRIRSTQGATTGRAGGGYRG